MLQILHKIDDDILLFILSEDNSEVQKRLQICINGNRLNLIEKNIYFKKIVFDGILSGDIYIFNRNSQESHLLYFSVLLKSHMLKYIVGPDVKNISFLKYMFSRNLFFSEKNSTERNFDSLVPIDSIDKNIAEYLNSIRPLLESSIYDWRGNIDLWDNIVEHGRNLFGEQYSFYIYSIIAAGIKHKDGFYENFDNLNDHSSSLCKRVRHARMKSGNIKWWDNQINNPDNLLFSFLVFFTWATPRTIFQLIDNLILKLNTLDNDSYDKLIKLFKNVSTLSHFSSSQQNFIEKELKEKKLPNNIKFIISLRFPEDSRNKFVYKHIDETFEIYDIYESKLNYTILLYFKDKNNIEKIHEIKNLYERVKIHGFRQSFMDFHHINDSIQIPLDIAKEIMNDCKKYPRVITSLAERSCRINANAHLKPVGLIAKNEGWFD